MKLWTIQGMPVWSELQKNGVFRATHAEKLSWYNQPGFKRAYDWYADEMRRKVPMENPPVFPVWAWYQADGSKRARPDLRYSGHLTPGTRGVRLELEVDEARVLLSDLIAWNFVHCNSIVHSSWREFDAFFRKVDSYHLDWQWDGWPDELQMEAEGTWDRIFDLEFCRKFWKGQLRQRSIQATFWELFLDDVRDIKVFTAR